ncbi:MAG TPA: PDC sensor domain-containing protein [Gallionellaceae bacterium]|nr:PDC sensor domain-containing protein [Gallionellaceae bacterium]
MTTILQQSIARQRNILKGWLSSSLSLIADDCKQMWRDRASMEARLMSGLAELPYCKYLYLLDEHARQITANASRAGLQEFQFGRDRSQRPYMASALAGNPFSLSDVYISQNARRPSLTAIQIIFGDKGELLGYLGADFDLRELPATQALYQQPGQWMQLKGDPAIRAGLFHQERAASPLDERVDVVLDILTELMTIHGVFHVKIHFSSSRVTLWPMGDPYRFRIHGIEELSNPNICLAYPRTPYPADADIPADAIPKILKCFRELRFMDETIYLRSGMLNIFNGMVGLTFSCDGSHYMPWREFLDKKLDFWTGPDTSAMT